VHCLTRWRFFFSSLQVCTYSHRTFSPLEGMLIFFFPRPAVFFPSTIQRVQSRADADAVVGWVLAIELCSPWLSRLTLESLLSYSACQRTSTRGGPAENLCRYVDHPQISLGRELIPPHRHSGRGGGFLRINIGATIPSAALHSLYIFHLYVLITSLFLVLILALGLFSSFLFSFLLSLFGVGETALVGWFCF